MIRKFFLLFALLPLSASADAIDDLILLGRPAYCRWAFEVMFRGIEAREATQPDDPSRTLHSWNSLTPQERTHLAYYFHLGYSMADRAAQNGRTEPRLYGLSYKSCMGRKDLHQLPKDGK